MSARLTRHRYGKHRVRISKVRRPRQKPANQERHELVEASVNMELEGDFDAAFTQGDNRSVVATDTCKNTLYALARDHDLSSIEAFGLAVVRHFIERYDQVATATASLAETVWRRIGDSPHGFVAQDRAQPTAVVSLARGSEAQVTAGVGGLLIAKTTESGFSDFHRDEYRTLADTSDRILATELTAAWRYDSREVDFQAARRTVTDAITSTFVNHFSRSVQDTLYRMGTASIDACPSVAEISLTMPNKHHVLVDLEPFGRDNENEVFVVTDEPFGYITGTVARE